MKKLILLTLLFWVSAVALQAQSKTKFYGTGGMEMIFSFAQIDNNGYTGGNIMRWSPVFNFQGYGNVDFNKHFGVLFGVAIRNVGFIYDVPDTTANIKKKFRNYNFGLPVGIKVGNMNKFLIFGGYEIEFPFHYKEKTFINDSKQDNKISTWFTSRTPSYYHSVFAGVQFPYGFTLKFKYYFSEFFNQDFVEVGGDRPYQGLKANVWYFSLSFALFKNNHVYYKEYIKEAEVY